jgi:hypothetical protein
VISIAAKTGTNETKEVHRMTTKRGFHFMKRKSKTNDKGQHAVNLGVKIGYWPCLKAVFISVTVAHCVLDFWYGDESYKKES